MDHFQYKNGQLFAENVPVSHIAAKFGTPVYIYSKATLTTHYQRIADAFAPLRPIICYSIKSLPNLSILKTLVALGAGMDVTSGGELFRALQAGCHPSKIFFAGVGKTDNEIREALSHDIRAFNVESEEEFWNLDRLAADLGKTAHAALRVNPGLQNRSTHTKTFTARKEDKFGINIDRAAAFYRLASQAKNVRLHGLHLHLGSPIKFTEPYAEGIAKALALIDELATDGIPIETLDTGGGFAAFYEGNEAPAFAEYAATIVPLLIDRVSHTPIPPGLPGVTAHPKNHPSPLQIIMEPGRSIAANAGILLAQIQYTKAAGEKKYLIIDAAMNDLIRPTLYESYHFIWPANPGPAMEPPSRLATLRIPGAGDEKVDIVGPICESGDYLAKDRFLPPTHRGDLLAIFSAGAYGMSMSSNYNSRPRAAEVLVDNDSFTLIRKRESYEDLLHGE